jgi:hypothetical protein
MNFKTTLILIVLLAAAGIYLFVSRNEPATPQITGAEGARLVDLDSKDVNKLVVTPSDGVGFTLEKIGSDWQITQPIKAPAETFEVDSLVRAFTDAKARGRVNASSELTKPSYQVQIATPAKTVKLAVGEKPAVGDNLDVQVDGNAQAQIVSSDISDKLDKGFDSYRKMNLVTASSDQIKQITITRPQGKLVLQKSGANWEIVEPQKMPADESAASDLVFALTGLRADSFVDPKSVPSVAMARPQLTVAFTTAAPVTLPATAPSTQPAWTTVQFGSYDDILKKNVYVTVEGSGAVAKVPATSLDAFKKTPLELRDKKVVNLDPDQVSKITLATNLPATTQPTTRAATNETVVIERRKVNLVLGPAMPTSKPTTQTAATAPATKSTESKWVIASDHNMAADDAKVTTLLGALHPLMAEKYLESAPTTQPAGQYVLTVTTVAPGGTPQDHLIALIDPGHDQSLLGSYNGLHFQAPRSLLTDLQGTWVKK